MKNILLLAFSFLFLTNLSYSFETSIRELNQYLRNKISSDKRLSIDSIKGEWLSTYHQAQIFPGNCHLLDHKVNISLALHDAWQKLVVTPGKGRKLEPIILTKVEGFPMADDGVAEILGEVLIIHSVISGTFGGPVEYYCTPLDELTTDAKALLCFQPFGEDVSDHCGWYSFFIRE